MGREEFIDYHGNWTMRMAGVIERYPELGFARQVPHKPCPVGGEFHAFRPYTKPWPYGEDFTVSRRHRGLFPQTVGILGVGER